jgi:hypothetical protein
MKEKSLLFILLIYLILINISLQQIIIPIGLPADDNKKRKEDEEDKPIVETKEIKDDKGNHIKITRITYNRTKNLNGFQDGVTPFQIMRIFDERINSIFDDFIRQSIGIKLLLNGLNKIDEEDENEFEYEYEGNESRKDTGKDDFDNEKEFDLDDDEENEKNKVDNANNTIRGGNNSTAKRERKIKKHSSKNYTKIGKLKVNLDNIKGKIKKKKKLSRRELIFSRVCKYIFYSIVLFTIYILVKKLLEILEIIDPDNATEVKIENDEMTTLKKTSGGKIS